jgi:hypothetical protein
MKGTDVVSCVVMLLAAGAFVTGCCAAGGGGQVVRRAGPLSVARVDFKGWQDAYRIANGEAEVVVVPQIARIMAYGPAGGENVLWVNEALTPLRAGGQHAGSPGEWQNFGGYKLWPAPQKDWDWPPDAQLDCGPCQVEVTARCSLRLIGMASDRHGIRFDREIALAAEGSRLEIVQTALNTSSKPLTTSIWDVTQVKADCVGFVPLGPGATYRTGEGAAPDEQWSRAGEMLLVKPAGKNGKVFISGPPAWLGCRRGNVLFLKAFEKADAPPPDPETPREVYTGDMGYTELEIVGPAVALGPGQSTSLKETWHLLPVGPEAETDEALVRAVRQTVRSLGLEG